MATTDLTRKVTVRNRTSGSVGYQIPSLHIRRDFSPPGKDGDFNYVSIGELVELTTVPGGMYTLLNLLVIEDEEARQVVLGIETTPEYEYSEKEVYYLLHEGTPAQLLDALDFAPIGVLNLIKDMAIQELPDNTAKINAINSKFKIDVYKLNQKFLDTDPGDAGTTETSERRSEPVVIKPKDTDTKSKLPKYNVVK
jgi:hypothetical protein